MTGSDTIQQTRHTNLSNLAAWAHRRHYGDYDETYEEFEEQYLGGPDDDRGEQDIPQYASIVSDETYSLISVHDDVHEALAAQTRNVGNESLHNPAGVYDLDTGNQLEVVHLTLTRNTWRSLGGIVAMSEGDDVLEGGEATNKSGIFTDWDELRAAFPLEQFKLWAEENDVEETGEGYDPEAGF